ncbi:MAG: outer rane adhesin like protein, partial [Verrucomicrobiales bacterium]|nr:outer rane adhesin like protein [Verrucomicrobiales bacterium]
MKSILPFARLWLLLFTVLLANTRIFAQANDGIATLTIRTPVTGDTFTAPAAVRIGLVATDPDGDIRHVEFFANAQSIGRSDQWTKDAVIPGKPREHFLDWTNVAAGDYKIVAKATNTLGGSVESNPVAINVLKSVVVSIEATVPATSEPSPLIRVIPGKFILTRTGEAKDELAVFLNVGGTATPDKDYTALPGRVLFPAGDTSVALQVNALDDDLLEADESIIATLTYPPLANPLPPAYSVNPDKSAAKVIIHDPDNVDHATLVITSPQAGENFPFGITITINATAIDPRGYIARVEFYDFEQQIGVSEIAFFRAPDPGTPIYHSFDWKGAAVGKHSLTARAFDSSGLKVVSAPVEITVAGGDETPVVSIRFVPSPTLEPWPNADFAPGSVEISRTGSTAESLLVFFELGGTATAGVDYKAISPTVLMGAGESSAFVKVSAIDDTLPEGDESVTFTLTRPTPGVYYKDPTNYQIDPEHRTASITILDNDTAPPSRQVVLAIEARDASASESGINGVVDPAVFVVKRVGGPNDVAVVAQYTLSGTAVNGVDYSELSGHVELPGGTMLAEIVIKPIADKAIEGEESVVIQLQPPICPAIFPPLPSCYLIADPASARATIKDSSVSGGPRVVITTPADGSVFRLGQPMEIAASATDPDGSANTGGNITRLDILADGTLLSSTKLPRISMTWSNATVGAHTTTAKASDLQGLEGRSEPVRIMVLDG